MIRKYGQFVRTNEEAAPRIPNSPEYWIKKLGKKGKDVMLYTHDDLDGIFSAIAIKKYLIDHDFDIIGYGLVSYQEGWSIVKIDPEVINVAVDFAETHPDVDVYIDHHGEFVDGDKITDEARKRGSIKTKTGSAYEGIMDQLGLPVDSLVLSVIDMVDSAKYDEYGVKWTDLLDFDPAEIKKKPNAKLLFAGAFNQLLKRGEDTTIIEVIHNVDEPSIYKIFDYMKRLYPGNNLLLPRGVKEEDLTPEELETVPGKDFVGDSKGRIDQMKTRTRGHADFKGIVMSQEEFKEQFTEHIEHGSRSKYSGQTADVIKLDGYCVIGEMAFLGSGTWANAIRARAIIQQDVESGRLPKEAGNIKWVLLQYGDTLQICSYGKIENYPDYDLPKSPEGKPIDDLKVFCVDLLAMFRNKLTFGNDNTIAGGHKGIGSISNVGSGTFSLPPDSGEYYYLGFRYLDLFKNYIIASLSKVPWKLDLSWQNPFSPETVEQPIPMNAKVLMVNQIRKINKKTGEVYKPGDYERRPSMRTMRANEIRLKQIEEERAELARKDHLAIVDARQEYYRTHGGRDLGYEEWSKLSQVEKDKLEKEKKEKKDEPESDVKTVRENLNEGSDWILLNSINKFVDEYSGDFLDRDRPLYDTIEVGDEGYDELVAQLDDKDRETYDYVMKNNRPMTESKRLKGYNKFISKK